MSRDLHDYFESIGKKIKQIVNTELAGTGIGHAEGRVLYHVAISEQGIKQEDICSMVRGIDRSNVGRALKKLEQQGYVIRKRDPDDARAFKVFLSDKGRETIDLINAVRENIRRAFIEAGISSEEDKIIREYLSRVDERLNLDYYLNLKNSEAKENI